MIHITIHDKYGLEIRGHAGAGPVGGDIVCAAVSVLADTYAVAVRDLGAEFSLRQGPGRMEIRVGAVPRRSRRELAAVRAAILVGLGRVSQAYPDRVRLWAWQG